MPRQRSTRRPPQFSKELKILFEDDSLIVIDKPPGLTAVPGKGLDTFSALTVVTDELRRQKQRALVVHRIDRFTSGLMIFAKTQFSRDSLVRQFLAHTPEREYLAVVRGRVAQKEGKLVHYFRKEGLLQTQRPADDPTAARAELLYKIERPLINATLVRATLITGLQNQIRVQFSAIGHPIVGDRKYHPEEASEHRIARVALHAAHLGFIHPRTNERISVDSELPADFRQLLQALTKR